MSLASRSLLRQSAAARVAPVALRAPVACAPRRLASTSGSASGGEEYEANECEQQQTEESRDAIEPGDSGHGIVADQNTGFSEADKVERASVEGKSHHL
jgi:hypothetical protein